MTGYSEFLNMFGDITILHVAEFILACIFLVFLYKKVKDYFVRIHDAEQERDAQLQEAITGVRKYPEYRQQSIDIQNDLTDRISGLENLQNEILQRLERMEESARRADRNKLRDKLLQSHRYYTNPETNPSGTWTSLEAEAFWEFFREYEDKGGNGFIHSVVQRDMERIPVVDIDGH